MNNAENKYNQNYKNTIFLVLTENDLKQLNERISVNCGLSHLTTSSANKKVYNFETTPLVA